MKQRLERLPAVWLAPVSILVAIAAWQALVVIWRQPAFILPGPLLVCSGFLRALADGSLLRHTLYTLEEVLSACCWGAGLATVLGYLLAKSRLLERLLSPYLGRQPGGACGGCGSVDGHSGSGRVCSQRSSSAP